MAGKAARPNQNQLIISVEVRRGRGDTAFLADVRLGNLMTIYDFPVWKGKKGSPQPALPTKMLQSERLPVVNLEPPLQKRIFEAIRAACAESAHENYSVP